MTYEVHKDKIVMRAGQYDFEAYGREVVARWMMENGYATGHGDTITELLTEIDLPTGVFQLLTGGPATGDALMRHPVERVVAPTQNGHPAPRTGIHNTRNPPV